eukprot:30828-Amphidinium_carterae.1
MSVLCVCRKGASPGSRQPIEVKGAYLVPAYGFGTNQQFRRLIEAGGLLAKLSSALKLSAVPWLDRFYIPFGPIPTTHKVIMALGPPIPVEKVGDLRPEPHRMRRESQDHCF